MIRTVLAPAAAAVALVALAGCAPGGGGTATTPAVTVTETTTVTEPPVTVTATPPAAEPTAGSPITAAEAYAICRAIADPQLDPQYWTPLGFDPVKGPLTGEPGAWTLVRVGYSSKAGGPGAAVDCTVNGTLGSPVVTTKGPYDFG